MSKHRVRDGSRAFNRELSWLAFNERVLEEAADATTPLLERIKFAAITASNLDEFFMVRVAGLKHEVGEGDDRPDLSGLTPAQQLEAVSRRAHAFMTSLYALSQGELVPALASRGIRIANVAELTDPQRTAVAVHFRSAIFPVLTPLAIDVSRPFPMLSSLSLNVAVWLAPAERDAPRRLAVVQVPAKLARLVRIASAHEFVFVYLEDVIRHHLDALFPGQQVVECTVIRLARDAEMELDDEGGRSYIEVVEEELRRRRRSDVVRLEVEEGVSDEFLATLVEQVKVAPDDIYRIPGPLDVRAFMTLLELPGFDELRDESWRPVDVLDADERANIFALLDERDILLHHPYESFDPVVEFVVRAADDPDVLAIKQTLYRTSGDSPIVQALRHAADQGKQVTVLVELLARFDEERNLKWVKTLEEAGAHVIYGIQGYKTHAKVCLVVKRTADGIQRYVHLSTGNYNDRTARLYTDFGLMTSAAAFTEDASAFFSALTGYSDPPHMKKLVMAPTNLRDRLLKLIAREQRRAETGQSGQIRAKLNSLIDADIIEALYAASQAGVLIQLNVRGICALKPGVPGMSERIEVVSIVDRLLEHSRIFYFRNGGQEEVYLASADWMSRNLDKRIELMFPVEDEQCRAKVLHALDAMFRDNVKARSLRADGLYERRVAEPGEDPFRVQAYLYEMTRRRDAAPRGAPVEFVPRSRPVGRTS
ncbi:MAG: polyphosphate kinase 1 [Vicinamibacterales bacterium]